MPKKSSAAHKAQAARRSQVAARFQNVALVRASGATGVEAAPAVPDTNVTSSATVGASTAPKPSASAATSPRATTSTSKGTGRTATATRPATTTAKPGVKPAATSQGPYASREQERRVARAKEMRRIREANMVTAEHYRYVLHDLRLTGILAALMFTVIIVLHFVLG